MSEYIHNKNMNMILMNIRIENDTNIFEYLSQSVWTRTGWMNMPILCIFCNQCAPPITSSFFPFIPIHSIYLSSLLCYSSIKPILQFTFSQFHLNLNWIQSKIRPPVKYIMYPFSGRSALGIKSVLFLYSMTCWA